MPSGSMLPHCRSSDGDGDPRPRFHTCRYALSNAYTVLFSVATTVSPRTTSGDAYTLPASLSAGASLGVPAAGIVLDVPAWSGVPWYIGQSAAVLVTAGALPAGAV